MYVLQVYTGRENLIRVNLPGALAPSEDRLERRGGRIRTVRRVLIPGYVFLDVPEITAEAYYSARRIPGVLAFLGGGLRPEPMPPDEAEYIRILSNGGSPLEASDVLQEGGTVEVVRGPLKGMEGRIVRADRRAMRVTVELSMYGRARRVSLSANFLRSAR